MCKKIKHAARATKKCAHYEAMASLTKNRSHVLSFEQKANFSRNADSNRKSVEMPLRSLFYCYQVAKNVANSHC